jgi:hypothetical protein
MVHIPDKKKRGKHYEEILMAAVACYSSARFAAYTPSDVSSTTYYYRVKKTETNEVPEEKKTTGPKSARMMVAANGPAKRSGSAR